MAKSRSKPNSRSNGNGGVSKQRRQKQNTDLQTLLLLSSLSSRPYEQQEDAWPYGHLQLFSPQMVFRFPRIQFPRIEFPSSSFPDHLMAFQALEKSTPRPNPRPVGFTGDFFFDTFRFSEIDYDSTRKSLLKMASSETNKLTFTERTLFQVGDDKVIDAGAFDVVYLKELRQKLKLLISKYPDMIRDAPTLRDGKITVTTVKTNAKAIHLDPANENAVIQAASQFNCLEFTSPKKTPEDGISGYVNDHTQGPACAIACAAGTAARNYVIKVNGKTRGQTADNQINSLDKLEGEIKTAFDAKLWSVKNGYINSTNEHLEQLNRIISLPKMDTAIRDNIGVGVQLNTEVTIRPEGQASNDGSKGMLVTQVYCSAVGVGYYTPHISPDSWEPFARLILEAAYEITLLIGIYNNWTHAKSRPVFLTRLGGGVFENKPEWIDDAIRHAVRQVAEFKTSLDIRIVEYAP